MVAINSVFASEANCSETKYRAAKNILSLLLICSSAILLINPPLLHAQTQDTIISRLNSLSTPGEDFGLYPIPTSEGIKLFYTSEFYDSTEFSHRELRRGDGIGNTPDFNFTSHVISDNSDYGNLTYFNSYGWAAFSKTIRSDTSRSNIRYSDNWESSPFRPIIPDGEHWEGHPSLSADGTVLFFASRRPGGYGGTDIWYMKLNLNGSGRWEGPYNAGPKINTPNDEISPYLFPDGKTLYFSSNSTTLPGIGGFDVYAAKSTKKISGIDENSGEHPNFSRPSLVPKINSPYDECFYVTIDTSCAFFCSNRPREGGSSDLDIYKVTPSPHLDPEPYIYHFQALDCQTGKPVQALFRITEQSEKKLLQSSARTGNDGTFSVVEMEGDYLLTPVQSDYIGVKIRFGHEDFPASFVQHIYLSRIGSKCIDTLPITVQFHKCFCPDGYFLTDSAKQILNDYADGIRQLISNGGIAIDSLEIEGHTDEDGGDKENLELSKNRATAVREYLSGRLPEISSSRITSTGFGKRYPIEHSSDAATKKLKQQIDEKNRRVHAVIKFQPR